MGEEMSTTCRHCGTEDLDHRDDCPAGAFGRVRLSADAIRNQEIEILRLRQRAVKAEATAKRLELVDTIAHALVLAYRDARREGVPPSRSSFVMGILRELDAVYERASFDPPPEKPNGPEGAS